LRGAVEADRRAIVDEIERDDVAFLHIAKGFHDRRELSLLCLDCRQLGFAVVVLETFVERIDQLVGGEVAQQIHLDPARTFRQHAGEIASLGRQIEAPDIHLENGATAYSRAVQDELLPSYRNLVRELHPADLRSEGCCREKRGDTDDQELAHCSVLLMKRREPFAPAQRHASEKRAARGTGSPLVAVNAMTRRASYA